MRRALDGDPVSAFGSVLGVQSPVDAATAEVLAEPGRFVEAIVAPSFDPAALEDPHHAAQVEGQRAADGGRPTGAGAARVAVPARRRRHAGARGRRPADDPEAEWKVVTDR